MNHWIWEAKRDGKETQKIQQYKSRRSGVVYTDELRKKVVELSDGGYDLNTILRRIQEEDKIIVPKGTAKQWLKLLR